MNVLVFVLAFLLIALLAYMGRYSARLRVERTRVIDAPVADVWRQVADLQQWSQWCPWLDPDSDVDARLSDVTDRVGSRCSWNGKHSGEGSIEHLRLLQPQRIEQRVRCQLPFAFRGKLVWTFAERDGLTEVHWSLRGRVSFSLRFVAPTVKASLALEQRYALDRLARLLEPPSAPHYKIAHVGVRDVAALRYAAIGYRGSLDGLAAARRRLLVELQQQMAQQEVPASGAPLALYLSTNTRMRTTSCLVGVPLADGNTGDLALHELGAQRAYVVRLQGSHAALDIAWYLAMQRMLAEGIAPDQRLAPFETYLTDEGGGTGNGCVTELHIPVRH